MAIFQTGSTVYDTDLSKVVNEYLLKELDGFPMKEIIQ